MDESSMTDIKIEYIECCCHSLDHLIRMCYFDDPDSPLMTIDVAVQNFPWYKRLWVSVKYIFGYYSDYNYFSAELELEQVEEMRKICENFEGYYANSKS